MIEGLHTDKTILTYSGIYVDVFNPIPEMIDITDIAHALAVMPRFGGHLPENYTVGQHCLACAAAGPPEIQLELLLHDGTEAYMMDMPRPIKQNMPEYKKIEDNLMAVIAKKFNLVYPFPAGVKEIDRNQLELEYTVLRLNNNVNRPNYMRFQLPWLIKERFLKAYEQYSALRQ